jgi:hypothetical protein
MTKSKKVFIGAAVIFLLLLGYASFDIGKRTTFPHRKNKGDQGTAIQKKDTMDADSALLKEKK